MTDQSVLVLDAEQRSALAVVRSLGARGISVHAGAICGRGLAARSRWVRGIAVLPDPARASESYLRAVREYCGDFGIGTVMPMAEVSSQIVLRGQAALQGLRTAMPSLESFERACDKSQVACIGRELGIPVADLLIAAAGDQTPRGFAEFGAPVVLKPTVSRVLRDDRWIATGVRIATDANEYRRIVQSDESFHVAPFIVQRFVPGAGAGVFFAYQHGRCVASFAHRRLREKPPSGGVSVLSESIRPPRDQLAYGTRLLDRLDWHGVAMVEFRVDREGVPWLMEINPRFWGSLQLSIDSGVDFPWIAWQLANREPVAGASTYVVGRKLRWLLGDLDHMLISMKAHAGIGHSAAALMSFLTPSGNVSHEVNRWSDLGPAVYELREWLRHLRKA